MTPPHDGSQRGLLDAALFADEPTDPSDLTEVAANNIAAAKAATPVASVIEGGMNYALMNLAPGLYEVKEPDQPLRAPRPEAEPPAEPPSPVQVQLPTFDLKESYTDPDPPTSYDWPDAVDEEEAAPTTVVETNVGDEPTVEVREELPPVVVAREPEFPPQEEPAPDELRPLTLAVNSGLDLGAGESAVLTPAHLRVEGDDAFLLDLILMSAPEQGALLRDGFALTGGDVFTQEDIDQGRIAYRHEGDIGEDGFVFATPAEEVPPTIFAVRVKPAPLAPEVPAPMALVSPLEATPAEAPETYGWHDVEDEAAPTAMVVPVEPPAEVRQETLPIAHESVAEITSPPEAVEEPAPAERRPLKLAANKGLDLGAGESAVLTPAHLRVEGDDAFLLDLILMSAPEQGALLRDGFALTGGDVFTQEDIDQGRIAYRHEGDIGEDGFVFATPAEEVPPTIFAVRVKPGRLAPELLAPGRLVSPLEGTRVGELLQGNVRSHEANVAPGLAMTGASGRGQWEYSLDGGASWQPIGDVDPSRAFLLGPTHTVRFVPRAGWVGRVQLAYRAWDRSSGEAGTHVDLSGSAATGGATAFSEGATSVSATVQAPLAMLAVSEPWREPPTVADLAGDSAAIVRTEGEGVWQFSLDDGRSWQDFGSVFHGRARVLRGKDRVRFLPRPGASGRVMISCRLWDGTGAEGGAIVNLAGHRTVGEGTPYSDVAQTRRWRLGG